MNSENFSEFAVSLPGTEEAVHFDRMAYKVKGKRIFATLDKATNSANLKLSLIDQSVFTAYPKGNIYPVNNKWGLQGWTTFELENMPFSMMRDALETAYQEVFKKSQK